MITLAVSQATFSSLCLSSKHFLLLAREYLYYRPLDPDTKITWKKAFSLIEALVKGNYRLAQLVGSLEGLVYWIVKLGDLDDPPPVWFSISGCTKTFSWYLTILKSCSKLVSVDLLFNNERHKTMVLNALKPSLASLKTISLVNHPDSNYRINYSTVRRACHHDRMKDIETLKLVDIDFSEHVPIHSKFYVKPSLSLSVKSLHLVTYDLYDTAYFLPYDSSNLRSFVLEFNDFDHTPLPNILKLLPASLEVLSISNGVPKDSKPPILYSYLQPDKTLDSIPFSSLGSFPRLSKLTLRGLTGPIRQLMDSLASSSPLLAVIDLKNSMWSRTNETAPISRGKNILDSITTLSQLKYLHLGYLPTVTEEKFEAHKANLNGLGIQIEWEYCVLHRVCTSFDFMCFVSCY